MEHSFRVSICIMAKNEEKHIRRCLDSLKMLIDKPYAELIFVDTGSKDDTVNIAREYTDKIYHHPWNDNFSDMRNITISYAKGEWLFMVDADEELENPEEAVALFEGKELDKYYTARVKAKHLINMKTSQGRYAVHNWERIFRNDGQFHYEGAVHNQPIFKIPVVNTDITFIHYGFMAKDKGTIKRKFDRTGTLLMKELEKDPGNIYYQYQLAASYFGIDKKKALEEIQKCYGLFKKLPRDKQRSKTYIFGLYARISHCNKQYSETVVICEEGLRFIPQYVDLYYIMALCQIELGQLDKAAKSLEHYLSLVAKYDELKISKDSAYSMIYVDSQSVNSAYQNLAYCCYKLSQYEKALDWIAKVEEREIIHKDKKILLTVKILCVNEKHEELWDYYSNLEDDKDKYSFIDCLEKEKQSLTKDFVNSIEKTFARGDDHYSLLNKIRISGESDRYSLIQKLTGKTDFNAVPLSYADIFIYSDNREQQFSQIFRNVKNIRIRRIAKYLLTKEEGFEECFIKYLLDNQVRQSDIQTNRMHYAIAGFLLANQASEMKENGSCPEDYYYDIFEIFVERGNSYLKGLYQPDKFRLLYKTIDSEEEQFLILMGLAKNEADRGNLKRGIEYVREAVRVYPCGAPFLKKYNDKLFHKQD